MMDRDIATKIFQENKPALILFYKSISQDSLKQFKELKNDDILIVEANMNEESNNRLAQLLDVQSNIVKLIQSFGGTADQIMAYTYDDQLHTQKLEKFIQRYEDGMLYPDLKSQEIPERIFEDGIAVIVGHNFDEFVQDSSRYALVWFYDMDCDFCRAMLPNLIQLNNQIRFGKTTLKPNKIKIGKIKAKLNQIPGLHISKLPTLLLYTINDKDQPIEYKGDRTSEGIYKWLEDIVNKDL